MLASSAKQDDVDHYLDLLDARELADGWTTSSDVEATKPEPDLVQTALERPATSARAPCWWATRPGTARRRSAHGVQCVAVLTGGFSNEELSGGGAGPSSSRSRICSTRIDETPFGVQVSA